VKQALSRLAQYPAPVRILCFILLLLLVWVPLALPISLVVNDPNTSSILTLPILYVEFVLLVRFWGRRVYHQPNLLWSYGLEFTRRMGGEWLTGLAIGLVSVLALFGTQILFGWLVWKGLPSPRIVLEGLLIASGIGFAEELLFRGWLLDELERDYTPNRAMWIDATIFALIHFIKPLDQLRRIFVAFPALLLLGLTLVWAKRARPDPEDGVRKGLGLPMGLHGGLVWGYYIVNVGQVVSFPNRVPEWLTGIDRNPLASVTGLVFLGILAWVMQRQIPKPRARNY
jgi:membrane protease YdiL (CAAX protease family)